MNQKKGKNITVGVIAIVLIGLVIWYFYNTDQARIKGFTFGNNLQQIQDELKTLQTDFNLKIRLWEDQEITKDEFLYYSQEHFEKMEELIIRYDELLPPEPFVSAVELFKLSTQTQLESDKQMTKWIETGDESASQRSDSLIQQAFEYELAALSEFKSAKAGITTYPNP